MSHDEIIRQFTSEAAADLDDAKSRFLAFHHRNPEVYIEFSRAAYQARMVGMLKYSAYAIMHVVRWNRAIQSGGDEYKINNNYVPLYARMWMLETGIDLFETRERTSKISSYRFGIERMSTI